MDTGNLILADCKTAAAMLSISPSGLRNLLDAGKIIAPRKLGNRVLFDVAELRAWSRAGCPNRLLWSQQRAEK